MTDATVQDAAEWAAELTKRESRGPGDWDNAMRRASRKAGVSYSVFWRLRYRRPNDVMASVYFRLRAAYEAERQRRFRLLEAELETTKAIAGADRASVRAATALVATQDN